MTIYRTLDGEHTMDLRDTHACPACEGRGTTTRRFTQRTCYTCEGTGRLAGADPYVWPVPVEVIGGGDMTPDAGDGQRFANERRPLSPSPGA